MIIYSYLSQHNFSYLAVPSHLPPLNHMPRWSWVHILTPPLLLLTRQIRHSVVSRQRRAPRRRSPCLECDTGTRTLLRRCHGKVQHSTVLQLSKSEGKSQSTSQTRVSVKPWAQEDHLRQTRGNNHTLNYPSEPHDGKSKPSERRTTPESQARHQFIPAPEPNFRNPALSDNPRIPRPRALQRAGTSVA